MRGEHLVSFFFMLKLVLQLTFDADFTSHPTFHCLCLVFFVKGQAAAVKWDYIWILNSTQLTTISLFVPIEALFISMSPQYNLKLGSVIPLFKSGLLRLATSIRSFRLPVCYAGLPKAGGPWKSGHTNEQSKDAMLMYCGLQNFPHKDQVQRSVYRIRAIHFQDNTVLIVGDS